ncbi:MAG: YkgJ family cysteine cluster protein [Planctomycetota bacterium]|jgi:Fe-S-cluster containining protein
MKTEKNGLQDKPWYANGLRFKCQRSGNCCRGEPGYVWVTAKEVEAVSSYVNKTPGKFSDKYLRKVGRRTSLVERPNGDCIMYSNGCSIYEVRPKQCRTFPFWRTNLKTRGAWEELKESCPGVDKGRLYTTDEIEEILGE